MVNRDIEIYMDQLSERPFFMPFSAEDIAKIKDSSIIRQFNKGQMIFYEGDPKNYYYFVLQGLVKIEKVSYDGEHNYIDFITINSFFSYGELFSKDFHRYNGEAEINTTLLMIPTTLFETIVSRDSNLLLMMYKNQSAVLSYQEKRIQLTSVSSATERVELMIALWMLDLGINHEDIVVIPYPLTIIQLSEVAGTTRETAGKVVKWLTDDGKINYSRKKIVIFDVDYFKQLIES